MEKQKVLGLAISLVIFTVCIILVELFLWFFAPVPDPYMKYYEQLNQYIRLDSKPYLRFSTELEKELPGADGLNIYSTNNMGFRGDDVIMPKPENEFRIFIVGASNAQCFYLDDSESIDASLQKELSRHAPTGLSIKVYNAGKTISNSDDIISMIVHRIVHLNPDMIVYFSVDLYAPLRDYDYLHFLKESPREKFPLIHFLATEFQIFRRIYYIFKNVSTNEKEVFETVALKSKNLEALQKLATIPVSDTEPKTNIPAFKTNLLTVMGVAKSHNIQLVFMTSASTWNSDIDPEAHKWHLGLYYNGIRYRENLMDKTLESYNDEMRRLSDEYSVPLFDLVKTIPKSSEYFYDDVHFNKKGTAFAGRHLASFIMQKELLSH